MVRDGKRAHAKFAGAPDERPDTALSVKERIAGVQMQVNEIGSVFHGLEMQGWQFVVGDHSRRHVVV